MFFADGEEGVDRPLCCLMAPGKQTDSFFGLVPQVLCIFDEIVVYIKASIVKISRHYIPATVGIGHGLCRSDSWAGYF